MKFSKEEIKRSMLLYAVTDRMWLKEGEDICDVVEEVVKNGATFMQIREKELDDENFYNEAVRMKEICNEYRVPFVVNDNIDIAIKCGADGVHVGQSDIAGKDVRAIIGADMILGISVSTVEEALLAQAAGADYVGVGAMFATGTKKDAHSVTNETLKAIVDAIDIPVVAIGGIGAANLGELGGTGIDGVAVVSAIFAQENPGEATAKLLKLCAETFVENGALGTALENIRIKQPVMHNITNYVTVNDCANITLACGASPVMSDNPDEVEEIITVCGGLNINTGTLTAETTKAMFLAGKKANEIGLPAVLDPVGIGSSKVRTDIILDLIDKVHFAVIRGNISEIKTIIKGEGNTKGVDADVADAVTEENLAEAVEFAKAYAKKTGSVIAITGAIDIVACAEMAYVIYNGHRMMSRVTGTGCMLSALTASYAASNPDDLFEAAAAAVISMGVAGEIAYARLSEKDGNSSYRNYIIDAIYNLSGKELEAKGKYKIM